jgi:hypothetical protein
MTTLSEMKRKNKFANGHFFEKGKSKVIAKVDNYVIVKGASNEGFVIFKYIPSTGRFDFVDNPEGQYSWQPYTSKSEALFYAKRIAGKSL